MLVIVTPIDRLIARDPALPALFTYGFRPFFLGAALTAALAVPAWLAMLATGTQPLGPFHGLAWHAHEMIFGYLAAVIAGFILTAVPNWTGRLPVTGWPLVGLFSLWIAGRVATAAVPWPAAAAAVDLAFLFVLGLVVWREVLAGRNFRNAPVAGLVTLFAAANLLFHLDVQWPGLAASAERLAIGVAAILIGLVGGRIIPSFTRNWMVKAGLSRLPASFGRFDKVTIAATGGTVALWIAFPQSRVTGTALLLAGGLHLIRLARWRGPSTIGEPIVAVLHVGYLWLGVSLMLLGLSPFVPVMGSAALHALTAGAFGTMTLAVMTRASLGHTGRPISTDAATATIYVLVTLGALLRVAAPLAADLYLPLLILGGLLWSAAFGLFAVAYGPILLKPGLGRV
jgi:uncharacterized protein involved in response to NO